VTRWDTYQLLCRCLVRCCEPAAELRLDTVDWPALIEASSYQLVTPALGWCLSDKADIPRDVAEYIDAALFLNGQRNAILLDHLESLTRALNAIEITPVPLKGAAVLAQQLYPHVGMRVLGDLDLLVPGARSTDALDCARALGFVPTKTSTEDALQHLPLLIHDRTGAALELHLEAVYSSVAKLVPTARVFADAVPLSFRGAEILVPSPTDQIAHTIVHSQIVDGFHFKGVVPLRRLLEVSLLCKHFEGTIDWPELARRFRDGRCTRVLERTISLAHGLFGFPSVAPAIEIEAGALKSLRRAIERPQRQSWGFLRAVVKRYLHATRAAPYRRVGLLNPLTWARRLAMIGRILRTERKW
jgi:Uncharacterised nucleotidyltransferase